MILFHGGNLIALDEGALIGKLGVYSLSSSATLTVSEDTQGLLMAEMTNEKVILIIDSTKASKYQKWFYYWDKPRQSLWFWSSDIGGHVWSMNANQKYQKQGLAENVMKMPEQFWQALPRTLRKRWQNFR